MAKAPKVRVTLTMFDTALPMYRVKREAVKLSDFKPLTFDDYRPSGGTPLIDATYEFLHDMSRRSKPSEVHIGLLLDESGSMAPTRETVIASVNTFVDGLRSVKRVDEANAGKGFLVIATDGEENSSRQHTYQDVSTLVREFEQAGWVTVFMGANIDAWSQGRALGLSGGVTGQMMSTDGSSVGMQAAFASVSSDSIGYLADNASYKVARGTSSVRSLSADGKETPDKERSEQS